MTAAETTTAGTGAAGTATTSAGTAGTGATGTGSGAGTRPPAAGAAVPPDLRAVLATGARPARPTPLAASLTFGWRALLKIRHVPEQLFDVTVFPIMLTLMFTYLFGGALAGSTREYVQFLLPGILVQAIVMITVYTGVTVNTDITKGVFDRLRSLPIWQPSALVGALLGDVFRYSIAAVLILALGLAIGFRPEGGALGVLAAVAVVIAFSFSLTWVWTVLAMVLRTPNSVMGVSMMILFPLTFVSNIFVRQETLPGWLQAFVDVNPITHTTNASRGLMHGVATAEQLGWVALSCALLLTVFGPLTMRMYRGRS
ncbi:ABC transporter permease [Parafrankia sp. FMc6]|uniref:ABC transporter permease n=1 Tax=Parafrankia soli TaxID=2599596 RepID=UPI0034D44CBE